MFKIQMGGKLVILAAVAVGAYFSINQWMERSSIGKVTTGSSIAAKASIGGNEQAAVKAASGSTKFNIPKSSNVEIRLAGIPWNAQIGLQRAMWPVASTPDGDFYTAGKDSMMAHRGINFKMRRIDDYSDLIAQQLLFAKQVAAGVAQPTEGVHFAIMMGDGYGAYVAGMQEAFAKINQQVEVISFVGYSRGEDKFMTPPNVKIDKNNARGLLVAGVPKDGDWNILINWAIDNDIPFNPNPLTYDKNAINFTSTKDFVEAGEKLISGACEQRKEVIDGRISGREVKACIKGIVTWTPGDVTVAEKIGGLVSIASTKEYRFQMPAVVIGNKKWMEANQLAVENMLAAAFNGAEFVRTDSELQKGAEVAAIIYKEQNADYWAKYYKGVQALDKTGAVISLGGSLAANLGDNVYLFGMNTNDDLYKKIYHVYAGYVKHYYPTELSEITKYESVVNTKYIRSLMSKATNSQAGEERSYQPEAATTSFAKRQYSVAFQTGKSSFAPGATTSLQKLVDNLASSDMIVEIIGHTDDIGNVDSNMQLSENRAIAIKDWMNQVGKIPAQRMKIKAMGPTQPIADNKTVEGRAKNRRVEIELLVK